MDQLEHVGRQLVSILNDLQNIRCPLCDCQAFDFAFAGKDVRIRCGGFDSEDVDDECGFSIIVRASKALKLPDPFSDSRKPRELLDHQKP